MPKESDTKTTLYASIARKYPEQTNPEIELIMFVLSWGQRGQERGVTANGHSVLSGEVRVS